MILSLDYIECCYDWKIFGVHTDRACEFFEWYFSPTRRWYFQYQRWLGNWV